MAVTFSDLPLKCAECGSNLIRITETHGQDRVACVECGALNDAKEVIEHSAGLIRGSLTPEQILNLREQVRVARKQAN